MGEAFPSQSREYGTLPVNEKLVRETATANICPELAPFSV
jgi:hypothetical protein